jgi:3-methyladenine DNA glycosylase AlkD
MTQDVKSLFPNVSRQMSAFCHANANPDLVRKYARYFREGYDAFGLNDKQVHELADSIAEGFGLDIKDILSLGLQLFESGKYEFGSVAILLLKKQAKHFDKSCLEGVRNWFDAGVNNWAHSDVLCSHITPLFLQNDIVELSAFEAWRCSASRWTRRAVPVTMLCLRKSHHPESLLNFIDCMMSDDERVVHQGLGWFLRELWKLYPSEVEAFLLKHKDHCARLIIQYATEKMSPDMKQNYKKTKAVRSKK